MSDAITLTDVARVRRALRMAGCVQVSVTSIYAIARGERQFGFTRSQGAAFGVVARTLGVPLDYVTLNSDGIAAKL